MPIEKDEAPETTAKWHRQLLEQHGQKMDPEQQSRHLIAALSAEGQSTAERALQRQEKQTENKSFSR